MNDTAASDLDKAEQETLNVFTYETSDDALDLEPDMPQSMVK